jgi:hypothetical protein
MSNVFVITEASEVGQDKDARIAYANLASTATTITASHDTTGAVYTYDGMTTLKWRPANANPTLQFDGSFADVDYIGLAGVNWNTAGCSLTVKDSGGSTLASISGLKDNQPALLIITKGAQATIDFEFSCANTLLEVGEVYFGESLLFPKNVSVGYQPGRWTSNDIVTSSRTEANQFGPSVVRTRGTTESFQINFLPTSFMDDEYRDFIDLAKGLPIFFLWNKNESDHAIYGRWEAGRPSFVNSLFSSISLKVDGVA